MRWLGRIVGLMLVVVVAAGASFAQGAGGGGAFGDFREKHKYTFQLMQMVRHIGEIDKQAKYALTADQARRVLAVVKPLRSKPKLTQDEAKKALKDLKPIFTVSQLNAMAKIKPMPRMGRPGGAGGAGGPGGVGGVGGAGGPGGPGGGGGGNRPRMDASAMANFNPFFVDTKAKDEWTKRRAQRWTQFYSQLEDKAGPKKSRSSARPKARSAK